MHSYTPPTQLDTLKHHSDLSNRLQLDSVPEPYIYPLLAHETGTVPLASRKRDLDSSSDSGPAVAGDSHALAIMPLTPDDDHGGVVRRSLREHKKPKPYFKGASSSLPVLKARHGLKVGFFK